MPRLNTGRTAATVSALLAALVCLAAAPGAPLTAGARGLAQLTPRLYLPLLQAEPALASCSFSDDFSAPSPAWPTLQEGANSYQVAGGVYAFNIDSRGFRIAHGGTECDNMTIELDAEVLSFQRPMPTSTSLRYGVVFRYVDPENWYAFELSPHGQFRVIKMVGGEFITLRHWSTAWVDGAAPINAGEARNKLRVQAVGPQLTFSVNDKVIYQTVDAGFSRGYAGVSVGGGTSERMTVNLDNFVQRPAP